MRPALLIAELPSSYSDWLVCMMSSQQQQTITGIDDIIRRSDPDFPNSGLKSDTVALQKEVLDFVEFLLHKNSDEESNWSDFSLSQAMSGLEDDDLPEYTDADLKEKWA